MIKKIIKKYATFSKKYQQKIKIFKKKIGHLLKKC